MPADGKKKASMQTSLVTLVHGLALLHKLNSTQIQTETDVQEILSTMHPVFYLRSFSRSTHKGLFPCVSLRLHAQTGLSTLGKGAGHLQGFDGCNQVVYVERKTFRHHVIRQNSFNSDDLVSSAVSTCVVRIWQSDSGKCSVGGVFFTFLCRHTFTSNKTVTHKVIIF